MPDHSATVAAIYEAFGTGDIPRIIDHLANDIRWEEWADNYAQKAGVPWLLARTGKAGALEFFKIAGGMNGIMRDGDGLLHGAACWRADDAACGWSGGDRLVATKDASPPMWS